VVFAFALAFVPTPALAVPAATTPEAQIKAGIVFNLAMVVTWPESAVDDGTFTIGVVGHDDFDPVLSHLDGKEVRRRKLILVDPLPADAAPDAQIVYISRSQQGGMAGILAGLSGEPVLTVSDVDGFCEAGGMVELRRDRNRIQLRVNRGAAERAGLRLSSQLLKMAEIVEGGG